MRFASIQYSAPPDPLAGFKGAVRGGKGGEGKGSRVAGREGRLTLMCSWNRAADWLRPALDVSDATCIDRRLFNFQVINVCGIICVFVCMCVCDLCDKIFLILCDFVICAVRSICSRESTVCWS